MVKLTNEHGFTYGAGIQTLSSIISSDVDDAKVRGSSMTLRAGFSYDAASNMSSSKGAFISATKFKFMAMMEAATTRLEAQLLYGNVGLGVAEGSTNVSATSTSLEVSDATWAAGIWAGQEGAEIDLYDGATLENSNAALVIASIDNVNKAIVVTGNSTDIAAIDVTLGSGSLDIFFRLAKGNEMVGLRTIVSNTGSLFGIDGASYGLWQGNTFAVGAANLTLKKIYQGVNLAVSKGLMEDVVVLVSPATYATLANDEASLRRYNAISSKAENGFESICYYGPNGKIEVIVHPMVKEQEAMAFPMKRAERIGSTDLTFKTPGREDEMFQQLADQTGYECRLYSEQAIFLPAPAKCVLFTGISNA